MGRYRQQYLQALGAQSSFYRRTAMGREAGASEHVGTSPYLHDVFGLCADPITELELRQFMPPASLQAALASLQALGLIECVSRPVCREPANDRQAANRSLFVPAPIAA